MALFDFLEEEWVCNNCQYQNPGSTYLCSQCQAPRTLPLKNEEQENLFNIILARRSQKPPRIKKHKQKKPMKTISVLGLNVIYPGLGFLFAREYILALISFLFFSLPEYFLYHNLIFLVPLGGILISLLNSEVLSFYLIGILVLTLLQERIEWKG